MRTGTMALALALAAAGCGRQLVEFPYGVGDAGQPDFTVPADLAQPDDGAASDGAASDGAAVDAGPPDLADRCKDGIRNGSESDIDCGGGVCPTCGTGRSCLADTDCSSGTCTLLKCL